MIKIEIDDGYIQLDQLLKLAGVVNSGAEAHIFIEEGRVKINDVVESRKRKKLYDGDIVEFMGEKIKIYGK